MDENHYTDALAAAVAIIGKKMPTTHTIHGPCLSDSAAQASARKAGGAPCARPRDLSHHGLSRAPVGALAGNAGGVGSVSEFALRFYTA